jgi:hypothetical protein
MSTLLRQALPCSAPMTAMMKKGACTLDHVFDIVMTKDELEIVELLQRSILLADVTTESLENWVAMGVMHCNSNVAAIFDWLLSGACAPYGGRPDRGWTLRPWGFTFATL